MPEEDIYIEYFNINVNDSHVIGVDGYDENSSLINIKINNKITKIKNNLDNPKYCKLILVDNLTLIGFISIFEHDRDDRPDLFPWYATMFVKEEFRGNWYSKILNKAILEEAKKRGFKKIYLKTELSNYYEKFGAKYMENLNNKEKIYYFDLK